MKRFFSVTFASLFFIIAIFLQYCGSSQYEDGTINWEEFKKTVKIGNPDSVDSSLEGKPVFLSGKVIPSERIQDKKMGVSYQGFGLYREAQNYQWEEYSVSVSTSRTRRRKGIGNGSSTSTSKSYKYRKIWSAKIIDHTAFFIQEGHENSPLKPREPDTIFHSDRYNIGKYELSKTLLVRIEHESFPLTKESNFQLNLPKNHISHIEFIHQPEENGLYIYPWKERGDTTKIGDVRYFYKKGADTVSLFGSLVQKTIYDGMDELGKHRSLIASGTYSLNDLVEKNTTELVEGSNYLAFISFFLVFLSMILLDQLFKSNLTNTPIWKLFINRPTLISSLINSIWVFALLILACNYNNDFSIALIATPIIFIGFVVFITFWIVIGNKSKRTIDFSKPPKKNL